MFRVIYIRQGDEPKEYYEREEVDAELAALKQERDNWKNILLSIISPDGFYQYAYVEECPICEQVEEHAAGCQLAAMLEESEQR